MGLEFFLPPLFPTFQCTPSYSSTIVHTARSLFTHPPPPSPCSAWRILCIHAAAHSTHRLKECLRHALRFVLGLERCPGCCEQHRLHAVIASTIGLFYGDFFSFMRETLRHLAHIWRCLMRGPACLGRYLESNINPLHFGVVERFQPSSRLCQKPSGVDT